MSYSSFSEAVSLLQNAQLIQHSESFELAKYCAGLLRDKTLEDNGRELIIRVLDAWDKIDTATKPMWNDLIEASGLYPYVNDEFIKGAGLLRYELHRSPFLKDYFLHEEQHQISMNLLSEESVVLSAPTSFGKSLLIQEIVASGKYKNIVIVQPTLALLDETRKKLRKYGDKYKIILSTSHEPSETDGNVFLFTGERVVEYKHFNTVDFFVIDEFYKLSPDRDDERAVI
ncbi:MAG: DEAD/DEAH box helicase, partial [Flavobacteriales bacterium]|nr:DEAD/DEAH box helicase [Flavobacteriales bacterium]